VNGVSVVIPTAGGRAGILERSLDVILDDPATGEVLVVVDAVDAPTEELLLRRSARNSLLRLVPASKDPGGLDRGQANRDAGVREAKGELILAIDDDVEPEPGLVSAHAARQAANERLVLLGYMPVAPSADRRRATPATALLYGQVYERECRAFESAPDLILLRLWAGNMSIPRQAWLAAANKLSVGAYHVDREFGLRLRALGMEGAFDRRLRAVHHYRRTPAELLDDALSSGIGQASLHVRHPELSEFEPSPAQATGPRSLLWRGRSRARMRAVGRSVALAADMAAFARLPSLESMLVRAIWAIGFGRGVYEATTTL
jgi:hypothetical protein